MAYVVLAPFGYVNAAGEAVHVSRIGATVDLDARTAKPLLKSGVISQDADAQDRAKAAAEKQQQQAEIDDEVVEIFWPDITDSKEDWLDFAVRLGVSRTKAKPMTKAELMEYLNRLDNTSSE